VLIYILDLFGVAVFAISGALVAGRKQMDLFGVVVLAVVTGIGGGTLRDMLLGLTPVFWIYDPAYIWVAALTALATVYLSRHMRLSRRVLLNADAFGLALFCVIGAEKALGVDAPPLIAVLMGVLTGVFGGIIRDVLSREVPLIFTRDIYATAALLGSSVFVALSYLEAPRTLAILLAMACALALRLAAIRYHMALPVFSLSSDD
jgi:uncharacterized membrane protein YeiH